MRTDTAVLMSPDRVKMIGARRTRAAIIAHASFVASTSPAREKRPGKAVNGDAIDRPAADGREHTEQQKVETCGGRSPFATSRTQLRRDESERTARSVCPPRLNWQENAARQ